MASRCILFGPRVAATVSSRLWKNSLPAATYARTICTTNRNLLKEIVVKEEENSITVEGQYRPSPRTPLLVQVEKEDSNTCPLCALNLDIKHTDVLILSQFLRDDGCMLPRRVTGLCAMQQRRVQLLVAMSQKAGLMPNLTPYWSKKDPKKRYGSKKLNRYFDEATLPEHLKPAFQQLCRVTKDEHQLA